MHEYSREAMNRQMQTQTAITEHEMSQNPLLEEVRDKLKDAQSAFEREQQKLDMTPRLIGQKHNQAYGRQINVVEAAKQEVTRMEEEVRKGENGNYRQRYLSRLDEKRRNEQEARDKPQLEQAQRDKEAFKTAARTKWLQAGGMEILFEAKFEDMYADYVQQKMQGPDMVEQTRQKFVRSGRYNF